MINTLSILIPTYNNVCIELVRSLQAQASLLSSPSELSSKSSDFKYEILVADDGSTDKATIEGNRIINTLPHVATSKEKRTWAEPPSATSWQKRHNIPGCCLSTATYM